MKTIPLPAPTRSALLLLSIAAALGLPAPASAQDDPMVELRLLNRDGDQVATARLASDRSGLRVRISGAELPAGKHGVHIHATGKCEGPDFESAGPHYNPEDQQHGFLNAQGPHAGDLPMLEVSPDGTARKYDFVTSRVALDADSLKDADGSSLIIHGSADDYFTDPGGDSGDRVACGVISAPSGESSRPEPPDRFRPHQSDQQGD